MNKFIFYILFILSVYSNADRISNGVVVYRTNMNYEYANKYYNLYNQYIHSNNNKLSDNEIDFIIKASTKHSEKYQIPIQLVLAMIKVESNFNRNVISSAGAYGYMQIMPVLARHYNMNQYNPEINIEIGARYLSDTINEFGYTKNSVAAYNRGISAVKRKGYIGVKETTNHIIKVENEMIKLLNMQNNYSMQNSKNESYNSNHNQQTTQSNNYISKKRTMKY